VKFFQSESYSHGPNAWEKERGPARKTAGWDQARRVIFEFTNCHQLAILPLMEKANGRSVGAAGRRAAEYLAPLPALENHFHPAKTPVPLASLPPTPSTGTHTFGRGPGSMRTN